MREFKTVIRLMLLEKRDVLLSILFGSLAGISAVGLFANSGYLIAKAAIIPPLYVLTISIALLKLFSVTRAASRYAERYYSHRATFTILSNLRVYFFEKIEPLAPRIFGKYRSGDLLARIVGDVESLQNFFLRVYYPPIVMVIVFLATIAFTVFFSIQVALILVIGLVLTGFLVPTYFGLKQGKLDSKLREVRGTVSTEATEFLYGFRDLKLYQRLEDQEQEIISVSDTYVNEQERANVRALYSQSVSQGLSFIISWFVLGVGALLVSNGDLDGVFLAMLVMISLTVFENATPMAAFPVHYEDSRRAANRLFSVVEEDSETRSQDDDHTFLGKNSDRPLPMEVRNVSFRYPNESRQALKNVTLQFPAGSKTAIVGPSGSGKSTVLQLLLKVYQDFEGEIRVGDIPISQLHDEAVWGNVNTVLQSNHFFYGTIRENLLLAREELSDEVLMDALKKVNLHDVSLDNEVLEKGDNLSGGEKQRLAIARAMLKGSRMWLLDEPTSSVDVVTEEQLYRQLFEVGQEDTIILVSHRLTGLEKMDKIIVMDAGEVVEFGSFNELMNRKGYFYEMKQIEKSVFL